MRVRPGCERLLVEAKRLVGGRRYGLCCHGASVDSTGNYIFDVLCADPFTRPQCIFVPEHGLFGEKAYMEPVSDSFEPRLQVPLISLYGSSKDSLVPQESVLRDLDAVVFDLQDIGARYYTYLATMAMLLETCSKTKTQVIICDRPNPIGLQLVEGGSVKPHLSSFVGYLSVPVRHGLTAGEAARFHVWAKRLDLDLVILECAGLRRDMLWPDVGLPFVPPSPNIPDFESALLYPGLCLLEGTNVSEGRGTTMPFRVFGAPFIEDPFALARRLNGMQLPEVTFRPVFFTPKSDKWANKRCGGVHVIPLSHRGFRPVLTGLAILRALIDFTLAGFEYRKGPYEFVDDRLAIDLLLGDEQIRLALEQGADPREVAASFVSYESQFLDIRKPFLIYPD